MPAPLPADRQIRYERRTHVSRGQRVIEASRSETEVVTDFPDLTTNTDSTTATTPDTRSLRRVACQ